MRSPEDFLSEHPEPRPWELPEGGRDGVFTPVHLFLGLGDFALEVAVVAATSRPNVSDVRQLWKRRRANRAAPVLLVVLFPQNGSLSVSVCGPVGEDPPVVSDRDPRQIERIADAALTEPDRQAAIRFLTEVLTAEDTELPGIRNNGMFSTHALTRELRERDDWPKMASWGSRMLTVRGRQLVEGLGFDVVAFGSSTSVLRIRETNTRAAVAVFLDDQETPDGSYERFGGSTAVSHALAVADQEQLPFVVVTRGSQIRVYAATRHTGVGRKGRAETFIEANLTLLPEDLAGALPLLFGAPALEPGGTFGELLELSKRYATGLGERLRDRVYDEVVPKLAEIVAAHHHGTTDSVSDADLDDLYETAMVILFRMLFVAYAEDKDLLPYRSNGLYQRNALKSLAQDLSERANEEKLDFDPNATAFWAQLKSLWRAIALGNRDWDIPAYNGGMFSSDPAVSSVGARIDQLDVSNATIGPAVFALLVDQSTEGGYGPVDFRSLSVREFGTIYEGLLESSLAVAASDLTTDKDGHYLPAGDGDEVVVTAGRIYLHNRSGARKATGSYFTKPFAVEHLLDHALDPAIDDHLARIDALLEAGDDVGAADAFFDFRVADIAMGSGHFLVAAVDHIEARFSTYLANRQIPRVVAEVQQLRRTAVENLGEVAGAYEIEDSSLLRRFIARRCIYGVDLNVIAVELARLGIWIHTFVPGLPLSFLDHNLVQGDSLTGIGTIHEIVDALVPPKAAPGTARALRDLVEGFLDRPKAALDRLARTMDTTSADISELRQAHAQAQRDVEPLRVLCDLALAVRTGAIDPFARIDESSVLQHRARTAAEELSARLEAHHFPIAFPELFAGARLGLDVVIGNPPWDKVRFEAQQFWVTRDPGLNNLDTADRESRISELRRTRPTDAALEAADQEYRELLQRVFTSTYQIQGRGHLEYAKLFTERSLSLLDDRGGFGLVLPRQSLVLGGWSRLRSALFDSCRTMVYQTRNRAGWMFDDVHNSYMVALVARTASETPQVEVWGGLTSFAAFQEARRSPGLAFSLQELASISDGMIVPWFDDPRDLAVFDLLRAGDRLSSDAGWITGVSESRWDFSGSGRHKTYASKTPDPAAWRVLMARHVNRLSLDTGTQHRTFIPRPAELSGLGLGVDLDEGQPVLTADHPKIVFRYPSRSDDSRTLIPAILPESGYLPSTGYVHTLRVESQTGLTEELALLGYLASFTCDWWTRRVVDRHVTAPVINGIPLPTWTTEERQAVADITATLLRRGSMGDRRLPGGVDLPSGIDEGGIPSEALLAELERVVTRGFGIEQPDIERILADFSARGCSASLRKLILEGPSSG